MPELIITGQGGGIVRHALAEEPATIGRDRTCEVPIEDPGASRRHARVVPTPDGYIVEDLGSKNGTLVNDRPTDGAVLQDGDRIVIGQVQLEFRLISGESLTQVIVTEDDLLPERETRFVTYDQKLLLSEQRLRMIYDLSERLVKLQGQDQLLNDALSIGFETLGFERGAIGVRQSGRRAMDWPVVRNLRGAEGELKISGTLLRRALEHGERAIYSEAQGGQVDPTVSMVQHGIRSAMCVPLMRGDEVLGVIYGDQTSQGRTYTQEDIDFLAGIAGQVSIGLTNCRLFEEQKEMARLGRELEVARTIQNGLFPRSLPAGEGFQVAALNEPGDGVSGDYYDVIDAGSGRVWLLIADVTGEGVPASLIMANLQAVVRATIGESDNPGSLLARWNDLIYQNTDASKFVTCSLMLLDREARMLKMASAGHFPPIILTEKGGPPAPLKVKPGYPLGVVEGTDYQTESAEMGAVSFTVVTYTDGIVEAMNRDQAQFGDERLISALADAKTMNPHTLVKQLRKDVTRFADGARQSDDITVVATYVA